MIIVIILTIAMILMIIMIITINIIIIIMMIMRIIIHWGTQFLVPEMLDLLLDILRSLFYKEQ